MPFAAVDLWITWRTYSGNLLSRPHPNFHFVAEPISGDLWELVKVVCDANGVASRIDHPVLQSSPSKQLGGFFHIDKVIVEEKHRGKDLGLHLIHQALVFVRNEWSLAAISPGLLNEPPMWTNIVLPTSQATGTRAKGSEGPAQALAALCEDGTLVPGFSHPTVTSSHKLLKLPPFSDGSPRANPLRFQCFKIRCGAS